MSGFWVLAATQSMAPAVLLWLGHNYRDRSPASRCFFWGGVVGYGASIILVTVLLIVPPVYWGESGGLRWIAIQWIPLALPLVAATASCLLGGGSKADGG